MDNWKSILKEIRKGKPEVTGPNSKVLLVDAMNTFIRCFSAVHKLNPKLQHVGGLVGFLKSFAYTARMIGATKIVLVFDGEGSNTNKQYLYPEYKANRSIPKVIQNWHFSTKEEENESMESQLVNLVSYLKTLPIHILAIDKIEADDVIGYLTGKFKSEGNRVTIMSNDRDFLQLVCNNVEVYSPTKRKFYYPKTIFEEFGVYPENFLTYKVFLGDKGDNVPKVKGFGEDKLFNLLPQIKGRTKITLSEGIRLIGTDNKWGVKLEAFKNQLEVNQKLMDLHEPNIPEGDKDSIDNVVSTCNTNFDKISFIKMYNEDQLDDAISNLDQWLENSFRSLTAYK